MGLIGDLEFVIHSLRHTCASRLVNAGVDLYVVCKWLGHSSIQITERYAHLNPDKLVHAVEVLEA
jgi:site-specific recombinase XerD